MASTSPARGPPNARAPWEASPRGGAAGAGRARERLGDVEPAVGGRAHGGGGEVVAVAALGDQVAEVEGGAGDRLRGVRRTPRPLLARRALQDDAELLGGRLEVAVAEREVAGPDADVGDVPEPVGGLAPLAPRVGDGPGRRSALHERRGAHRT